MSQRYTIEGIENNLMDPPEEPADGPTCEDCGQEMQIIESGRQGEYWWFEARCQCGNRIKDDNF